MASLMIKIHPGPAPVNSQPDVPSKFAPVTSGTTTATVTLDPWS